MKFSLFINCKILPLYQNIIVPKIYIGINFQFSKIHLNLHSAGDLPPKLTHFAGPVEDQLSEISLYISLHVTCNQMIQSHIYNHLVIKWGGRKKHPVSGILAYIELIIL